MKTTTKVILITAAVTIVSFSLSGMLAKNYGEGKMTQYLQDVANYSFNHVDLEFANTEESLSAEKLIEIEVNSTEVDLKIEKSSDDKIKLIYSKNSKDKTTDLIHINGLTMKIDFDQLKREGPWVKFNFTNPEEGTGFLANQSVVKILVPENIRKIKIKTVSGDMKVLNLDLEELKLESVSGHIDIQGKLNDINAKTISGDFLVNSDLDNPKVKISTVSGDTRAVFNSEPNINFNFETVSGEVSFSESLARKEISGAVKDLNFGKGEGSFEVQSTSGDVKIEKY
ncbi:MAG: DUF4097 family beta strand repeat-containing protein [Pseudobdellovibrio sp.]